MDKIREKITELFSQKYVPAHDIKHILRVAAIAKFIAGKENYNKGEAEIAGLLHDVGRLKAKGESHAQESEELSIKLFNEYTNLNQETKNKIINAFKHHSNKQSSQK